MASCRRFLKKMDKAFGLNGYKRKVVKGGKTSKLKFGRSSDDDCGGDN
jgi:hypothetical protein